jgi:hypothetical protein
VVRAVTAGKGSPASTHTKQRGGLHLVMFTRHDVFLLNAERVKPFCRCVNSLRQRFNIFSRLSNFDFKFVFIHVLFVLKRNERSHARRVNRFHDTSDRGHEGTRELRTLGQLFRCNTQIWALER